MSDEDEDDYLSDKFLTGATANSSGGSRTASSSTSHHNERPKTYSELRKEALRQSEAKNAAARKKGRRETVEEGLNTSLFEKAQEQEAEGRGTNKALDMMLKMGFKPGQALGRSSTVSASSERSAGHASGGPEGSGSAPSFDFTLRTAVKSTTLEAVTSEEVEERGSTSHRIEPIKVTLWEGKQGIGQKRSLPSTTRTNPYAPQNKRTKLDDAAKVAREKETAEEFRARTRLEYEEKRDEARLIAATRTCRSLDEEKGDLKFNYLWLNPLNPNTCPPQLLKAFEQEATGEEAEHDPAFADDFDEDSDGDLDDSSFSSGRGVTQPRGRRLAQHLATDDANKAHASRLRAQMQKDALQTYEELGELVESGPLGFKGAGTSADGGSKHSKAADSGLDDSIDSLEFTKEEVAVAREFLGLGSRERLERVLQYMRDRYSYCFWCGTQYLDQTDMDSSCPGIDEDSHE